MISCGKLLLLLIAAQTIVAIQMQEDHEKFQTFCWKDSYGRGFGSIPDDCGHRDKIGLLCYEKCPSGYKRWGFDCHQVCPKGWRDDGLFCRLAEYGRGVGYPWFFGDAFNDVKMFQRCEKDHGKDNCCLLYTSPSPRDLSTSRMPSSA